MYITSGRGSEIHIYIYIYILFVAQPVLTRLQAGKPMNSATQKHAHADPVTNDIPYNQPEPKIATSSFIPDRLAVNLCNLESLTTPRMHSCGFLS